MTQPAKAPEPSMEEILASIRRIIADDDTAKPPPKPPAKAAEPPPAAKPAVTPPAAKPAPPPPAESAPMGQDDIDAMLSALDEAEEEEAEPEAAPEVLELTEEMAARPEPKAPAFRKIDAQQDVVFDEPRRIASPERTAPPTWSADDSEPPLLSSAATAAVNSAFGSLAHTVLVQNAKTLEDLVKEMLRPLLKTWLDDNLPTLVERLVRAEIERASRGNPG
jgi:cell pole-organizing protein PopZ